MKPVAVFVPAVADIGSVEHVGDHDIGDAVVDLILGLFHSLAGADDDKDDSRISSNNPLIIDVFNIFDMNSF